MAESLERKMLIRPRCLITEFVNSECTAFAAGFQWTNDLSFSELIGQIYFGGN